MAYREKDYVLRQIAILARVLARVLGLKEAGRAEEARLEIERGAGTVLGLEYKTLERLDVVSAVTLLRQRERIEAYARLLETDADLPGHPPGTSEEGARSSWLRDRAAALRAALPPG